MKINEVAKPGIKVKNINGTSDNSCQCTSWLEHWRIFGGDNKSVTCSKNFCVKKADVGAHVQKSNNGTNKWYVIPLCYEHNKESGEMVVSENTVFVSANVSETCGT